MTANITVGMKRREKGERGNMETIDFMSNSPIEGACD